MFGTIRASGERSRASGLCIGTGAGARQDSVLWAEIANRIAKKVGARPAPIGAANFDSFILLFKTL